MLLGKQTWCAWCEDEHSPGQFQTIAAASRCIYLGGGMLSAREKRRKRVYSLHRVVLDLARIKQPQGNITIDNER